MLGSSLISPATLLWCTSSLRILRRSRGDCCCTRSHPCLAIPIYGRKMRMLRAILSYFVLFYCFVVAFCFIHVCLSILFRRFFIPPRLMISFSLEFALLVGWLVSARSLLVSVLRVAYEQHRSLGGPIYVSLPSGHPFREVQALGSVAAPPPKLSQTWLP